MPPAALRAAPTALCHSPRGAAGSTEPFAESRDSPRQRPSIRTASGPRSRYRTARSGGAVTAMAAGEAPQIGSPRAGTPLPGSSGTEREAKQRHPQTSLHTRVLSAGAAVRGSARGSRSSPRPPPGTAEEAALGAPPHRATPHRRHRGDARGTARLRDRRRSAFVRCGLLLSAGSAPRRSTAIPAHPSRAVPAPRPRLPTWMVQVYSLSSSSRTVQLYSRSRFLLLPLIHLLSIFPSRAAGRGAGAAGGASVHIPLLRGVALRSRPPPGPTPPHRARCGPSGAEQRGEERSARGRAAAHGGRGGGGPGGARAAGPISAPRL